MESTIVIPEFVDARVGPRGALESLSQEEIEKLLSSGQGGLYPLFRQCALAVLNAGSDSDNSKEIFDKYRDFDIRIVRHAWGVKLEIRNAPAAAFVDGEMIRGIKEHLFAVLRDVIYTANEIVGAGTGMYFGNSDGSAPFVAGLIERNVVRDTLGYNLQIKHQKVRPAGVGLPTGASVTVIRHNLLSKANNGALREFARPNLLVGHWPPSGDGADDTYLIHGNVFFANPTEALFQGEGNIALYGNLFLNPEGAAVRIQPHNGRPDRIDIFFNTVFARTDGIRVVGGNPAHRQQVWGNAIFAGAAAAGWDPRDNLAGALDEASAYVERFDPALTLLDPRPTASMLRAEIRDAAAQRLYPDSAEDLCGHPRGVVAVGAFAAAPTPPHFPLRKRPLREPFCP